MSRPNIRIAAVIFIMVVMAVLAAGVQAHGHDGHAEGSCPHHHDHGSCPHSHDEGASCPHSHDEGASCPHHHDDHGSCPHSHDEGASCPHHRHDHGSCPHSHDEGASCPHHHHEGHDHDHDHDHDHRHEGSDYDWIATVRDGSGAVVSEVPIILSCKGTGMVKLTPLTFDHMLNHTTHSQEGQGIKDTAVDPPTTESSDAVVGMAFYYTVPCGGLCEDAYKLYSASVGQLHAALWKAVGGLEDEKKVGSDENVESDNEKPEDVENTSTSNATSALSSAKRWLSKRFFMGQFEIPKSAILGGAYGGGSLSAEESTYGPVVKDKGPNGTHIFDFPTLTVATSGSAVTSIVGYSGPMTAEGLWYNGLWPQLLALHKGYCYGLSEVEGHLSRARHSKSSTLDGPSAEELGAVVNSVPQLREWQTFCAILLADRTTDVQQDAALDDAAADVPLQALPKIVKTFNANLSALNSQGVPDSLHKTAAHEAPADESSNTNEMGPPGGNAEFGHIVDSIIRSHELEEHAKPLNISDYNFEDGVLAL